MLPENCRATYPLQQCPSYPNHLEMHMYTQWSMYRLSSSAWIWHTFPPFNQCVLVNWTPKTLWTHQRKSIRKTRGASIGGEVRHIGRGFTWSRQCIYNGLDTEVAPGYSRHGRHPYTFYHRAVYTKVSTSSTTSATRLSYAKCNLTVSDLWYALSLWSSLSHAELTMVY